MAISTPTPLVFAAAAIVFFGVLIIFVTVLAVQRRRARAAAERARAEEDAERRRRKRRRAGLRSSEIDAAAPEARVVDMLGRGDCGASTAPSGASTVDEDVEEDACKADEECSVDITSADIASNGESLGNGDGEGGREDENEGVVAAEAGKEEPAKKASREVAAPVQTTVVLADGEDTCAVCLDDLRLEDTVRRLPCEHVFHSKCIRQWLRRKNACPCCCAQVVKKRRRKPKPPPNPAATVRITATRSTTRGVPHPEDVTTTTLSSSFTGDREMPSDRPHSRRLSHAYTQHQHHQMTLPRSGSLVDPENPNGDMLMSEASTMAGEDMSPESIEIIMEDVRRALRGEASRHSLGAYSTDVDDLDEYDESSEPPVTSGQPGHVTLDLGAA